MIPPQQNRSNMCRCVCSIRFLVGFIMCIIVICTVGYFVFDKNDIKNNHGHIEESVRDHSHIDSHNAEAYHENNQSDGNEKDQNQNVEIDEDNGTESSHNNTTSEDITVPNRPDWENNEEIRLFREYLRIPTVHPDIDYKPAVEFLEGQAASLNLSVSIYYPADDEDPVVVMKWEGLQPELPSIMLNSHMDVVPVYEEFWTHPPFAAEMDENGDIFARGAQDMKSVGMQYLAAIRALKREGVDRFKRTIYIDFVPDEEVKFRGMAAFVKTEAFHSMNVGAMLDEGGISKNEDGSLNVYYGERAILQTEFIFHGQSGHGSQILKNTPGEKLNYLLGKFMEMRKEEERKLNELKYPYGNITTINLTIIKGGVEANVIPAEMSATFDIRVSINENLDDFTQMLEKWCEEAGGNITMKFIDKGEQENLTPVDESNLYWMAFKSAIDELGLKVRPAIMGGTSDSRYIRRMNISALGFSPLFNTIPKLHDHDEYINAETYLDGIGIYRKIIRNLASL